MADKLEPSESLMPKIRALIDPPNIEDVRPKGKKLAEREAEAVPWKSNHDHCDFCGEGGDLLCCDKCPCAFHLACCEPPVDPDNIPSGDWLCTKCRPGLTPSLNVIAPFDALVKQCLRRNPTSFSLPPEYSFNTCLPGGRKKKKAGEDSRSKSSSTGVLIVPPSATAGNAPVASSPSPIDDDPDYCEGDRSVRDFCFVCNKTKRIGCMVYCDFCPLAFHLDCLDPPLTNVPGTLWMCPNHAEHHVPSFRNPLLSERCAAMEETSKQLNRQTVLLDFLNATRRAPSPTPPTDSVSLPKRNAIEVPASVKVLYRQPMASSDQCTLSQLCQAASTSSAKAASRARTSALKDIAAKANTGAEPGATGQENQEGAGDWWGDRPTVNVQEQNQWLEGVVRDLYNPSGPSDSIPSCQAMSASPTSGVSHSVPESASSSSRHSEDSSSSPVADESSPADVQRSSSSSPTCSSKGDASPASLPVTTSSSPSLAASSPTVASVRSTAVASGNSSSAGAVVTSSPAVVDRHQVCSASSHPATTATNNSSASELPHPALGPRRARRGDHEPLSTMLHVLNANMLPSVAAKDTNASSQRHDAILNDHLGYALPAVDRLDSRLLHLLAAQRLQQIVSGKYVHDADNDTSSITREHEEAMDTAHAQYQSTSSVFSESASPSFGSRAEAAKRSTADCNGVSLDEQWRVKKDDLLSAKALLCPVSCNGSPFPVANGCVSIGVGADMDLSLRFYSPCLRLSRKHACLFYDEDQHQYELLSYSEFGIHVDGVLYGCDVSQSDLSPESDLVTVDHVRSSMGHGPRTRRAQQRVESARRRWKQPHSMRYLQDLLSYCATEQETEDGSTVNLVKDSSDRTGFSDSDDEVMAVSSANLTNTTVITEGDSPPNNLQLPGLLSRPPRSPSPSASACLTPMENFSSWIQRQDAVVRSAGFWLPSEAEKCLPSCSCTVENGGVAVSGCVPGNWEGSAVLRHGSSVQFGCLRFVFSIAGKPGHDKLVKSLVSVLPDSSDKISSDAQATNVASKPTSTTSVSGSTQIASSVSSATVS
ncbi:PHD finger protein 12-like [Sycon ciliatum]|uniref:PHD finger protein 12-like n=1 Tax=Sycon ciliatum TaxID=27933 RepID=UPI0031F6910E